MAKSYPIAGIISSWFKACDKLGNGNISIQLLVSYMKRSNHGFLAQRTTHSAIPLTSLPKNTPRKHHARLNFKHLRIYVGLNNRCNCFGIIRNYCILSLLLCLVPKLYFSVLFNWHFDFFIQMSRTSCLPLSFHQKRGATERGWVQNTVVSIKMRVFHSIESFLPPKKRGNRERMVAK